MISQPVHKQRDTRMHGLIKTLGMAVTATLLMPTALAEGSGKAGVTLWDGLRANMSAAETAAYLKAKGVRVDETTREGVPIVTVRDREHIAGMKGVVSLGFSRKGLQTFSFDFDGANLPDYDTIVARLAANFGKPVGQFTPRLYHGYNGDSASAHVFFGGPPRSVSLFYRVYCTPYARRQPNEKSISIAVDLRPIAFPPPRLQFTGDADGWCAPS